MAPYSPEASFYSCPLRAADIFKPQPAPPPIYYLKDHVRVEYSDSDWPTTPEGQEEAHEEGMNEYNRMNAAGNPNVMVRARPPPGLLSVRMREHREKEKSGNNGSEGEGILEEGRFASPGMPSVLFPYILFTLVAERAAKADFPQGPPSDLKYSKVLAESNVKPPARKPLAGNAGARKNSKVASKPSRHRVQVVLARATEEKENLPHLSSDSDSINDPLLTAHAHPVQKNQSQGQELEQKHLFNNIDTLPDPFILTSSDECDDPLGGQSDATKGATAGEPDRVTTTESGLAPVTTADPASVGNAWIPKSCLRAANASRKGHTVSFKDPLLKFHFYYHPDPNDIWSQCGLSMRPTRMSFSSFLLTLGHSPASHS
jgi:hypothetical protein